MTWWRYLAGPLVTVALLGLTAPNAGAGVAGCPVLPADNIWNVRVDGLPVHPRSDDYIDTIGRGVDSTLCVPDPEPRVSTVHLKIEHSATGWFVEDISRNGTWLRDRGTGEERQLPHISRVMLPRSGELCLGRPFAADPDRLYTVTFDASDA